MTCAVIQQRFYKVWCGWTVETIRCDEQGESEGMGMTPLPRARTWWGIQRKAADELCRAMDKPQPETLALERFYDRHGRPVPRPRHEDAYAPLQWDGENSSGAS